MRELGFADARVTAAGPDGGIDVSSSRALAQVKWRGGMVGRQDLQALYGARGQDVSKRLLFFAASGYSKPAIDYADRNQIALFIYEPMGTLVARNKVRRHACTRWTTSQAEFLVTSSVAYVDSDMVPCSLAALPCLVDKVVVAVLRRSMAPDFRDRLHGRCVRGHNCRRLCFSWSPSGLRNGVVACQCPQHAGCVVDLSRRSQSSFIALTTGQAQLFPSERPRRDRIVRRPRSAEDLRRMGYVARGVQDRRTS
ncbi:restriction endonuclease [Rhodococcus qingshengii]|uniref:restriction endonuclease n=1 Tax=Rhodococcus qingshengii TaxID=334542 RepID=UPI0033F4294F